MKQLSEYGRSYEHKEPKLVICYLAYDVHPGRARQFDNPNDISDDVGALHAPCSLACRNSQVKGGFLALDACSTQSIGVPLQA